MASKTDLLLIGGLGIAAYWLLTQGKEALAAGGGSVISDITGGAGEVTGRFLQGAGEGAQDFLFNIYQSGQELGEKNANDILRAMDQAGLVPKESGDNSDQYLVGTTPEGLIQKVIVPREGYPTKSAFRTETGEMVTVLNGKRVDEMSESEFFDWKARAGYSKNEPIMGGVYLPGVGQVSGETLGTSNSLIKAPPKVEESSPAAQPTIGTYTSPSTGSVTFSTKPRSSDSGKSQAQLKAEATPDTTKNRLTTNTTAPEKPTDETSVKVPQPIYPTTGVGLPAPMPTTQEPIPINIPIDPTGGVFTVARSIAKLFGF